MEKEVRVFRSHEEADRADVERDMALTPEERIEITNRLREQQYPGSAHQRMERVFRISKLSEQA